MAYKLEEINFKTVADPKGFVEEGDAAYQARVSKAAQLIAENRKNSPIVLLSGPSRSEERRVGKECRSRWSPYH